MAKFYLRLKKNLYMRLACKDAKINNLTLQFSTI